MSQPLVPPIRARYRTCGIAEFDNNPLVAALPPLRTAKDWIKTLLAARQVTDEHRAAASHERMFYAARLKRLFIPDRNARDLAGRVDALIRNGLESRNPRLPERALLLQEAYERGQEGSTERLVFNEEAPISSMSLFGVSGMGKTTTFSNVLGAFPQYIWHEVDQIHQVVWLKVETPKDGSVRELGINILRAFDRVLGTDHASNLTYRTNVNQILRTVGVLAITHCLGVLVIDEVQNISVKKSGGREEVLNWFQELVNELKLPVILLGTPKAHTLFDSQIRHARRVGTAGTIFWQPLAPGSDFDILLDQLWARLVLRDTGSAPSDEMRAAIHDETQGIKAFMADMLLVVQLHALQEGHENITPAYFRRVVQAEFSLVQRFIKALRSKEPRRMAKYEDVCEYDIEDLVGRIQTSFTSAGAAGTAEGQAARSFVEEAISRLSDTLPLGEAELRDLVVRVAREHPPQSAHELTRNTMAEYVRANPTD